MVEITERYGHKLAIAMLQACCEGDADACSLEAEFREDEPQDVPALPYVRALKRLPATAIAGFAAVLSDFLTAAYDGSTLSPDHYDRVLGLSSPTTAPADPAFGEFLRRLTTGA